MLLVDNLTISFGGLTAVSNFSLKIGEKEVVGQKLIFFPVFSEQEKQLYLIC